MSASDKGTFPRFGSKESAQRGEALNATDHITVYATVGGGVRGREGERETHTHTQTHRLTRIPPTVAQPSALLLPWVGEVPTPLFEARTEDRTFDGSKTVAAAATAASTFLIAETPLISYTALSSFCCCDLGVMPSTRGMLGGSFYCLLW